MMVFTKILEIEIENYGPKLVMRHFKYNSNSELIENNIYQEYNYNSPRLIKINSKIGSNEIIKKGEFLYASNAYSNGCNTHPHNYFLQFLSEIGIIGFIFYLIFFVYLLAIILKTLKNKIKQLSLSNFQKSKFLICGSILIELIPLLPSGNFFNNWLSMLFFFKIGVLFFLIQNGYNKK